MRLSEAYIPTRKEIPADAVIPSHRLMLRTGMIRMLAAGVYSYLPLGWRVLKKVMAIIREEMDAIGGQELQLPVLNPVEIWDETGRNDDFGEIMFRLKDRKGRTLILAPTHEEVVCDLARKFIRSYKDLPQIWYQIQTKFRDEARPRSGVIRTRQFIMKDSYTLDTDEKGLAYAYEKHAKAYRNIFSRSGLDFHEVGASSGLMGGSVSQEFMVESEYGEDTLVLCSDCNYAANMEVAVSSPTRFNRKSRPLEKVETPDQKTIAEVSAFLKKPPHALMKSLLFICDNEPVMVLIRGDHDVNEAKIQTGLGFAVRQANPDEVLALCGTEPGFIGPIRLKKEIRIIADDTLKGEHDLTTGANEKDYHLTGIELDRDVKVTEYADIRHVIDKEKCLQCGKELLIKNAVEIGHIFQLGSKYAESMKAVFQDKHGRERPILMGSYGTGVERIVAAYIEQNHDEKGIIWNRALAPYLVHIIPLNIDDPNVLDTANRVYGLLVNNRIDAILDDRKGSPGIKFNDADLLGMPIQLVIGSHWLKTQKFELKLRSTGNAVYASEDTLIAIVKEYLEKA